VVYASIYNRTIIFLIFFLSVLTIDAMVLDNRYFNLAPKLYTGTRKKTRTISSDLIFMTGGDIFSSLSMPVQQNIGYPALFGKLTDRTGNIDLNAIDEAIRELTGNPTLLTTPLVSGRDAEVDIAAHLQAQGCKIEAHIPLTNHFSLGFSSMFIRTIGEARMSWNEDSAERLGVKKTDSTYYNSEISFVENLTKVQKAVGMNENVWRSTGAGDIVLQGSWYNSEEYKWKFRTIDFSASVGLIIPTGMESSLYNIASMPLGGQGHWGWFLSPHIELELKDDLKIGCMVRLTKRLHKTKELRVPILSETPLMAPYRAAVKVSPGATFSFSPYLVIEHVSAGFGCELRYSLNYHETDTFVDARADKTRNMKLVNLIPYSTWTQEYLTLKIFYDIVQNNRSKIKPVFNFTWDIPLDYVAGKSFAKTHGISLGCNFNF
jgi:hypothetical protein